MAPPLTRFTVGLRTDETKPKEFYHQICALSEKTINDNFKKLFDQRGKELEELRFFNGNIKDGKMLAILDSPRVTLQLQNVDNPQLLFRVRFKSGLLVVGKGKSNEVDLKDWEVTVSAFMDSLVANPTNPVSDKAKADANNVMKELEKSYDFYSAATPEEQRPDPSSTNPPVARKMVPGEYSIHRLFAAISEGAWNAPLPKESWVPGPDGTRITLEQWSKLPENSAKASSVAFVLSRWAAKHTHSAFFTLGLQVELPEMQDSRTATFTPSALRLQNYPYFTNDEIEKYRKPADFPVGTDGRDYNCFVYCEATDGAELPSIRRLPFTGNLAEPKGPLCESEISGSFVISHQLFMDAHLLPLLRDLSRAIQVIPLEPQLGLTEDRGDIFRPRFAFGSDPENAVDKSRLPNSTANRGDCQDKFFDWRRKEPGGYEWSDYIDAYGSNMAYHDYVGYKLGPFYRKWTINCKMSVTITWKEGSSEIIVKGRTVYYHWEGYNRSTKDFGWGPGGGAQWGQFTTVATWSFAIDLTVPPDLEKNKAQMNGVIEPKLKGLDADYLPTDFTTDKESTMMYVRDDTHKKVAYAVKERLSSSIKSIFRIIEGKFAGVGRFFYPGGQELSFGPPRLTRQGDIIATIAYKELPPGRIAVRPAGAMKYEVPEAMPAETVTGDPTLDVDANPLKPMLIWAGQVDSYDVPDGEDHPGKAKITLRARNNSGKVVAFHRLKLQMLLSKIAGADPSRLFTEDNPDEWIDPEDNIKRWKERVAERKTTRDKARKKAEEEAAKKKAEEEAAKKKAAEEEEVKKIAREEEEAKKKTEEEAAKKRQEKEAGGQKEEGTGNEKPAAGETGNREPTTPAAPDPETAGPSAGNDEGVVQFPGEDENGGSMPSGEEWVVLPSDEKTDAVAEQQPDQQPVADKELVTAVQPPSKPEAQRVEPTLVAPPVGTSHTVVGDIGQALADLGNTIGVKLGLVHEEPDPEPEPPVLKASYSLTTEAMASKAKFRARDEDGEVVFEVMAVDSDGEIYEEGKIIMPPGAKLSIKLSGNVPTFGKFIIQVMELWSDPTDDNSSDYEDKYASEFACIELNPMGHGEINTVPYEEAKTIMGMEDDE